MIQYQESLLEEMPDKAAVELIDEDVERQEARDVLCFGKHLPFRAAVET
jgi:hypothetical protein